MVSQPNHAIREAAVVAQVVLARADEFCGDDGWVCVLLRVRVLVLILSSIRNTTGSSPQHKQGRGAWRGLNTAD